MLGMWFVLAGLSLAFVAFDIRTTPAHPVIKWAFVILSLFAGPLGAFFYVLGCREPLTGTHEQYVAVRWRQVLGSTMHCAAGDGIGIIAGAALASFTSLNWWGDILLEYALGFGFGWAFFQSFAMRDMAGGSYLRSLRMTFLPEFLSMNVLMAAMIVTAAWLKPMIQGGTDPLRPGFWFVMSMALIAGFVLAYPMNWWLVARGLKHGMITVRNGQAAHPDHSEGKMAHGAPRPALTSILTMAVLSIIVLAASIWISRYLPVTSPMAGIRSPTPAVRSLG